MAQQEAMFTHYMFNTLAINPAYAGSRDALTITALHRSQWIGFDGAPVTQTITAHTPLALKNAGFGVSVVNDKIGPVGTTALYADFSYKIKVTKKSWLAFGLKGGLNIRRGDFDNLEIGDQIDPTFAKNITSDLLPNFGAGLYYFTDKYYVGLSIPKLMENNFEENSTSSNSNLAGEEKHYFLIAGYMFNLNQNWVLKPTGFLKVTNAAPMELDLSAQVIYKNKFWLGAMFRTKDAIGLLAGLNITDQLAVGYSFDFSFVNTTFTHNAGSHEIMLRYDFIRVSKKKIRSPRYF